MKMGWAAKVAANHTKAQFLQCNWDLCTNQKRMVQINDFLRELYASGVT